MARACETCNRESHADDCPELRWADTGRLRGLTAGPPPAKSMTLGEEMDKIFAGQTETMMNHVAKEGSTCPSCSR